MVVVCSGQVGIAPGRDLYVRPRALIERGPGNQERSGNCGRKRSRAVCANKVRNPLRNVAASPVPADNGPDRAGKRWSDMDSEFSD
jgi:hypothetical protein